MTTTAMRSSPCATGLAPFPRLILFDLDDTLGDYSSARSSRLRRAFLPHLTGEPEGAREQTLQAMIERSIATSPHGVDHFPELFAAFGIRAPEAANAAAAWYREHRFHDLGLFPEAVTVIATLRQAATPRQLGIVTNGPASVQRDKVKLLKLDTLVDFVVISGEVGIEKPDPRIFALALERAAVPAAEAVVVGDAPEFDIVGARRAGIRSIWINRRQTAWPYLDWEPTCTVPDLMSLVPLLRAQ